MIFNSNTTALGATNIPMAEGYDCSYGASLALVEAARNDFAMFKALVTADYKEMSICKESTGVVMEGELSALHEAVGGGIFKKIAELFKKLAAKVKAIFHSFISRITALFMDDTKYIKKYENELKSKVNKLGKLEVKFRVPQDGHSSVKFEEINTEVTFPKEAGSEFINSHWDDEEFERVKKFWGTKYSNVDSVAEYKKAKIDDALKDEETLKISEINGGLAGIINFIKGYSKNINAMKSAMAKSEKNLSELVNHFEKKQSKAADDVFNAGTNKTKEQDNSLDEATKLYSLAQNFQTAMLNTIAVTMDIAKIEYKQNKAALVKAVAANPKKLEENAIYLDAIAEAAEEEVDAVIEDELKGEELSDLSAASTNVKDADVKDDPDALTYGPDCYTDSVPMDKADGAIDTEINSKEESAFFGSMFY